MDREKPVALPSNNWGGPAPSAPPQPAVPQPRETGSRGGQGTVGEAPGSDPDRILQPLCRNQTQLTHFQQPHAAVPSRRIPAGPTPPRVHTKYANAAIKPPRPSCHAREAPAPLLGSFHLLPMSTHLLN